MSLRAKVRLSKNWKDIALSGTHKSIEQRFNDCIWYLVSFTGKGAVLTNDMVEYQCNINLIEEV